MENYAYTASYPESGGSTPKSREIDFENPPPWEENPAAANNYKVKFLCSYGGKIHPRPHDNQLTYTDGDTKILSVDRNIKFSGLIANLSALCNADVSFKYQLPGEDLDALISVTNDGDLEHMMHEYDRLCRASARPARLRLFLFPVNQMGAAVAPERFSSGEGKGERFVDALNSGTIQSTVAPPNNVDFFFGLEKDMPPPPATMKIHERRPEPEIPAPPPIDRVVSADHIQRQIQDMQRLQIGGQEQAMYGRKNVDNLTGGFGGDYYVQNTAVSAPQGYWQEKYGAGGVYQATTPGPEQPVYMIPAPTSVYPQPMARQVTGQPGQGYYTVQKMPPEVYREQPPVYNVAPPPYQPTTVGGVGLVDRGYTPMAYDSGAGRQVYYNAPGGAVSPPQYQAAAVSTDMRAAAGAMNQEGKIAVKPSQASMYS